LIFENSETQLTLTNWLQR